MLDRFDKLPGEWKVGKSPAFLKRIVLIMCIGMFPIFNTLSAEASLDTIYHIYIDELYIGTVDSKDVVQQVIDEEIDKGSKIYENFKILLDETISMIPERSFRIAAHRNEEVISYLSEHLSIVAQVKMIIIDGQVVGYFNSKEEASKVLEKYKMKFVTAEDLNNLGGQQEEQHEKGKAELSVDESRISNVEFSKGVSIQSGVISPDKVLDVDEGVKLLERGTLADEVHKVNQGEVMGEIAEQYDLSTKELLTLNPDLTEDSLLQIDQEINVTAYRPFIDVLVTEEKRVAEEINYDVKVVESDDLYKGEEEIKQEGKNGSKEVAYQLERKNGLLVKQKVLSENIIHKPIDKVIIKGTKVIPSRGTGKLTWPANGGYVSSYQGKRWGSYHKGIDIAGPSNRRIVAADHGVIESAGYNNSGYGNKIVINHNNGMKTVYAHLASFQVKAGQVVEKGAAIGIMGSTGRSTGIHLHFEVYQDGNLQNPMKYY